MWENDEKRVDTPEGSGGASENVGDKNNNEPEKTGAAANTGEIENKAAENRKTAVKTIGGDAAEKPAISVVHDGRRRAVYRINKKPASEEAAPDKPTAHATEPETITAAPETDVAEEVITDSVPEKKTASIENDDYEIKILPLGVKDENDKNAEYTENAGNVENAEYGESGEKVAPKLKKHEMSRPKTTPGRFAYRNGSQLEFYLRIAGVLTAICALIALLLAVVNGITADRIAENTKKEKAAAVTAIFTDADEVTQDVGETPAPVTAVYTVKKNGAVIGKCANVESSGFGGVIDMMVGVGGGGVIEGVRIISMSETPGLGSKTGGDEFLNQYGGKSGVLTVGVDIDAVAGASISSKAVTAGVNAALAAIDASEIGSAPAVDTEQPDETEAPDDGEAPVMEETDAPETDETDGDIVTDGDVEIGGDAEIIGETETDINEAEQTDADAAEGGEGA